MTIYLACAVYRTDKARAAEAYDCGQRLRELEVEYGGFTHAQRSVTHRQESLANFAIEYEDGMSICNRCRQFRYIFYKTVRYENFSYPQPLNFPVGFT
ncbi:hypothetical protein [Mycetohabitans endofungorum]|uniref:hypothetical protein n=1 Tax=Mycetohabitans endofungorum TaxID=417203 RepID=UPI002B05B7F0|nr:hypothetical protein [Mycetohabitans endofungorum]